MVLTEGFEKVIQEALFYISNSNLFIKQFPSLHTIDELKGVNEYCLNKT